VSPAGNVEHLERALIHIANDPGIIRAPSDEREAAFQQNPVGDVEVDRHAAVERQGNRRHRHVADAGEVVACVEVFAGRQERVRGHGASESCPQRRVGRVRELRT